MSNRLFRYDEGVGLKWKIAVRQTLTNTDNRLTQKGTFINNTNEPNYWWRCS